MSRSQEIILFSPLPVGACRSRLEDSSLPAHGSPIAGRVIRHGVELWRRHSVWRFFQPTLVVECFEADERTRLETEMRVSTSGLYAPAAYVIGLCVSLVVGAVGSIPFGLVIFGVQNAGFEVLRARARRGLATDGPFLREQLGRLVHAAAPTH